MPERTIDWGAGNSPYETHVDRNDNGRVVLAEDTSGGTVLLEYDESANSGSGGWISRGPVDLNSNDVSGVGTLTAASVDTDDINSNVADGTTRELLRVDSATAGAFGSFVVQHSPDVSTTAKTIWEGYGNEAEGTSIIVAGRDTTNLETFYDKIQYGRFYGVSVTNTQESGGASSRSYSINSNTELQLSMSADTYQVTITGIAASTPS